MPCDECLADNSAFSPPGYGLLPIPLSRSGRGENLREGGKPRDGRAGLRLGDWQKTERLMCSGLPTRPTPDA